MSAARDLDGRAALVTGSSAGLGLEIGRALARSGCRIMLHGLESADLVADSCAALEREAGVAVRYVRADLAVPEGAHAAVRAAQDAFGTVDILVNNAVVRHFAPLETFPLDGWNAALAVNLTAALCAIQAVAPGMRSRNWGRIFNMVSVYGQRGTAGRIDYVTTKAGLLGMTRAVAVELAGTGITCNALCPGSVSTPGTEARVDAILATGGATRAEAERQFLAGKQPTGRFVAADGVARLLAFLCGPAGDDVTGAVLPVDGGWLAS